MVENYISKEVNIMTIHKSQERKCCKCGRILCCCPPMQPGATGPQGPQGIQGEIGPRGPAGVTGATGAAGADGAVGPQGAAGATGVTGPMGPQGLQGEPGDDGTLESVLSIGENGNWYIDDQDTGVPARGPQGVQGIQGETGPQGVQGIQGETGSQGVQGIQGETGPQGVQGIQGETGPQGVQGIQGETGPQGVQGIQGETGPQGVQGIQGETGPQGEPGEAGTIESVLSIGENGNWYIDDQDTGIPAQGPQGLQGIQGPTGPTGLQGQQGPVGDTGPAGPEYDDTALWNAIGNIENDITDIYTQISNINTNISNIESFINLSDVTEIWSPTTALSNLGVAVIHSGNTYNFWGIGALDHQQTLSNGTRYNLIYSSQYEPLTWYQGSETVGTLWIRTPGGNNYQLPIEFDNTGIYFTTSNNITNLPIGTTFNFTQALILVDESLLP